MIGDRRHQDAGDDGPGLAQPRGKNEGKELGLVSDLCDATSTVEVRKASKSGTAWR
jgi:hypothetical protein